MSHHDHPPAEIGAVPLHGLLAEFATPDALLAAATRAYEAGFRKMDGYSSVPIDGLAEAIGYKKNYVAPLVFMGGLGGGITGFMLQWYSSVVHYRIDIGGRPFNSWPAFVPITFELTILGAATCAAIGMLAMNGLPKPYNPVFNAPNFGSASSTGYFLCIEAADPRFQVDETRAFLEGLHPTSVTPVDR